MPRRLSAGDPHHPESGAEFRYEILSKEDWYGRRLIAKKFRDTRVFLPATRHISGCHTPAMA